MSDYLITGATGTFGSALVRHLLTLETGRIIVFSRDEFKQHAMQQTLKDDRLRWFLGDVRDLQRLRRAFSGVRYVIHAAALKQVPACEYNPFEACRTNIEGTQNVIEAAIDAGVERVLGISTDKAVNPISLYGATKLAAERLLLAAHNYAGRDGTTFSVLRCGNFAYSRGSVIPVWDSLIRAGATELPVTDPDCTRYWMSEAEAVDHAMRALNGPPGVFWPVLRAYRVGDLADAYGLPYRVLGLREGEKLHEEMEPGMSSADAPRMSVAELREAISRPHAA